MIGSYPALRSAYRCLLAAAFPYSGSRDAIGPQSLVRLCAAVCCFCFPRSPRGSFPSPHRAKLRLLSHIMELSAAGDRVFAAEAILKRRVRKVSVFLISGRFAACD
ncbi:uncharacterized protein cbx6b [Tachysurus ichikawai]